MAIEFGVLDRFSSKQVIHKEANGRQVLSIDDLCINRRYIIRHRNNEGIVEDQGYLEFRGLDNENRRMLGRHYFTEGIIKGNAFESKICLADVGIIPYKNMRDSLTGEILSGKYNARNWIEEIE